MDDRYDRRELLLHLGDVMETMHRLLKAYTPDSTLREVVDGEKFVDESALLRHVAATMSVAAFVEKVSSAYYFWPKALLEERLNREALAQSVRDELFGDNPEGWNAFLVGLRAKVPWFGDGIGAAAGVANAATRKSGEASQTTDVSGTTHVSDDALGGRSEEERHASWPYKPAT